MTHNKHRSVVIRRGTISDAAGIVRIGKESLGMSWSEQTIAGDMQDRTRARYFVAVTSDGSVVGYVACWYVLDTGEIIDLAVVPEYRRQGIAQKIMNVLIADALQSGIRHLMLDVRESNRIARDFYEKTGFAVSGLRSNYYPDTRETALTMTKSIKSEEVDHEASGAIETGRSIC